MTDSISSTAGQTNYRIENLEVGKFYDFIVRAKNDVGLSLDSPMSTFLAAEIPTKPTAPTRKSAD